MRGTQLAKLTTIAQRCVAKVVELCIRAALISACENLPKPRLRLECRGGTRAGFKLSGGTRQPVLLLTAPRLGGPGILPLPLKAHSELENRVFQISQLSTTRFHVAFVLAAQRVLRGRQLRHICKKLTEVRSGLSLSELRSLHAS